jgi:hypothetical protein
MRISLHLRDLGVLGLGATVAVVAGLLAGTAMRPQLRDPADVLGPQIQIADSARGAAWTVGAGENAYPNGYPDYVVGTDSLAPIKGLEAVQPTPAQSEDAAFIVEEGSPDAEFALADWRDEELDPEDFSADGRRDYELDLPEPPYFNEADAVGG